MIETVGSGSGIFQGTVCGVSPVESAVRRGYDGDAAAIINGNDDLVISVSVRLSFTIWKVGGRMTRR